jgi:hypothetical protein
METRLMVTDVARIAALSGNQLLIPARSALEPQVVVGFVSRVASGMCVATCALDWREDSAMATDARRASLEKVKYA